MKKKLVIRFVKFECALAMQVLEMTGKFSDSPVGLNGNIPHTQIGAPCLSDDSVWLCPIQVVKTRLFESNTARDEYLQKVIKWISEEQFAENGSLEVGKLCDVSDDNKDWRKRILLAILPESYFSKYIASAKYSDFKWCSWKYARPIGSCAQPKIDGDVYTWEMEVA